MEKNHNAVFGPDDKLCGLDSEKFEFSSSSELMKAVATPGHPLSRHAKWIKNRLQYLSVKSTDLIRVDCDFNPPVVETVYSRSRIQTVCLTSVSICICLAVFTAMKYF